MLTAMMLAAHLCVGIGVYPQALYSILPYAVDYHAYDVSHVQTQLQLLLFAACAFVLLYTRGWYPAEISSVNIDTDWLYRRAAPALYHALAHGTSQANRRRSWICWQTWWDILVRKQPTSSMSAKGNTHDNAALAIVRHT